MTPPVSKAIWAAVRRALDIVLGRGVGEVGELELEDVELVEVLVGDAARRLTRHMPPNALIVPFTPPKQDASTHVPA
jgi:hypothetical protein